MSESKKKIGRKLSGTDFGQYRVGKKIGEGGYAWVYRATDVELERDCALKILLPRNGGYPEQLRERFSREAKLVGKLRDPRSIRLYEADERDDLLYMVFEYIEGKPLDEVISEEGALKPLRAVKILEQVMEALQDAHDLGIVHRDMKPGNVMLYEIAGRKDQVKVLDFGIGKFVNRQTMMDLTCEGTMMGTPRYMAPEQVTGKEVSAQSDIYGTGMIAYELLTGEKAIQADSAVELMGKILDDEEIRIPERFDIPEGLREIVEKMLRKEREDRYASAGEVLRDLKVLRREGDTGNVKKIGGGGFSRTVEKLKNIGGEKLTRALLIGAVVALVGAGGFVLFGGERDGGVDGSDRAEELAAAASVEQQERAAVEDLSPGKENSEREEGEDEELGEEAETERAEDGAEERMGAEEDGEEQEERPKRVEEEQKAQAQEQRSEREEEPPAQVEGAAGGGDTTGEERPSEVEEVAEVPVEVTEDESPEPVEEKDDERDESGGAIWTVD